MKYTPGPWRIERLDEFPESEIVGSNEESIMDGTFYYPTTSFEKGDWYLIAAAPELLEALREVVPVLEAALMVNGQPEPGSIGYKARAAIAKATGETL